MKKRWSFDGKEKTMVIRWERKKVIQWKKAKMRGCVWFLEFGHYLLFVICFLLFQDVEAMKKRWSFDGKGKAIVIRWDKENNCHSMRKGEDAWLRGRVEAIKKRRCVVAWTRRGDEKNVDA